jgi:hypothetical protein
MQTPASIFKHPIHPMLIVFGETMLSAMRFGFGGHIEGNESIDPEPKPKKS